MNQEGATVLYLNIFLIVVGLTYLIKPAIFMRNPWKRTAISQQVLANNQNKNYMRVIGEVLVAVGVYFIVIENYA